MELENIDEIMEELLELEISKLFKSIEGVTDVFVNDITIRGYYYKGPVNGYLLYILVCCEPYTIVHVCIS